MMPPFTRRGSLRFTAGDAAVLAGVAAAAGYLAYRVSFHLHYEWNWAVVPQYLIRCDSATEGCAANLLLQGFFVTVRLGVWAGILATAIGLALGLLRTSGSPLRRAASRAYVELIRNQPPLVFVFILYFFIGERVTAAVGLDLLLASASARTLSVLTFLFAPPPHLPAFLAGLAALALYEGAYIAEITRAGIESVERGQWDAACTLGLTRFQQMRYVILPQALRRILPPLAGQLISTVKDSAILSVISIPELTFQGQEIMSATYRPFEIWITVAALYFVPTFLCSLGVRRLEVALRVERA